MTTPGEFYASLPPICKAWGTELFFMTAATTLGIVNPKMLALHLPFVFGKFQVWRLLTTFLWIGGFSIGFLFDLLMIIQCGVKLEQDVYAGRPADFLFVLIFGMLAMLPCTLIPLFSRPFLSRALIPMLVYLWSRNYPNNQVSIWGLFSVPAFYFPWLLLFITFVTGGDVFIIILGFLVGHLYFFLVSVYPLQSGRQLLTTPSWVHWIIFKWAQNAPDMFPESASRGPPAPNTQRVYLRPASAASGAAPGAAGSSAHQQAQAQPQAPAAGQAFRGRAYRLDRD